MYYAGLMRGAYFGDVHAGCVRPRPVAAAAAEVDQVALREVRQQHQQRLHIPDIAMSTPCIIPFYNSFYNSFCKLEL